METRRSHPARQPYRWSLTAAIVGGHGADGGMVFRSWVSGTVSPAVARGVAQEVGGRAFGADCHQWVQARFDQAPGV